MTVRFVNLSTQGAHSLDRSAIPSPAVPLPDPDAAWTEIEEYALACAPKAGHAELGSMASRARRMWNRYGQLSGSVADLQACLFFEQRRWHLFGAEPDGRARAYAAALVLAIGSAANATRPVMSTKEPDAADAVDGECAEAG